MIKGFIGSKESSIRKKEPISWFIGRSERIESEKRSIKGFIGRKESNARKKELITFSLKIMSMRCKRFEQWQNEYKNIWKFHV
ncbi:hypothetical protein CR194_14260 [Salipaludibacillus keqinensis]|uniref:Uncharacterized protein n=1 Tax=Salipaludibacillus keqinensis TaxID=2045207 RepID=A0A323TCP7_9BACI|nr:hypothetical protein CR194_14260 [Salipaludibacillus keqinensis]